MYNKSGAMRIISWKRGTLETIHIKDDKVIPNLLLLINEMNICDKLT